MFKQSTLPDVFDAVDGSDGHDTEEGDLEPLADTDSAGDDVASTSGHTGRRWLLRIAIGVGAALFVAGWALAGMLGWHVKQQHDVTTAGHDALDAARRYAVLLTSVDSGKIDDNFNQVINGATGEFKDMYSQSAAQLRQLLIDNKAVSHGTVVDAAIKSATTSKVDVLIFVDQSISNTVNPQPRIDRNRITITMEKIKNSWLASKVDIK